MLHNFGITLKKDISKILENDLKSLKRNFSGNACYVFLITVFKDLNSHESCSLELRGA